MKERYVVYILYAVGFMDLLGVSMTIPLLTKQARDSGASSTVAGLIGSLYGFLQLFSSPVVGRWSDIYGRKLLLICCLLMCSIGYGLLAVGNSVLLLILARIPTGLFKHSQELSHSYLSDITPPSQRSRVFGRFNSISNIGFIVGPIIGGHIVDSLGGFTSVAMATAASFLLNLIIVVVLLPNAPKTISVDQQSLRDRKRDNDNDNDSQKELVTDDDKGHRKDHSVKTAAWSVTSSVWDVMLVRFLLGGAVLVYRHDFVSSVIRRYNSSVAITGYMSSFSSVVGMVSGFNVGFISDRYGNDSEKLFCHAAFLQTVSLALFLISPNIIFLALCQAMLSVSCAIGRVVAVEVTSSRGGREHTGTLIGAGATVISMSRMLAPSIGGISQEIDEDFGPLIVSVALATAGALLMFVSRRTKRKLHEN